MVGPDSHLGRKIFVVVLLVLSGACLFGAPNDVVWHFVNLPATGTAGQSLTISARVGNTGTATWGESHYLEVRDPDNGHLEYISLATTVAGAARNVSFGMKLPERAGSYRYRFRALQHGREYFGAIVERTIVVQRPPLEVSLVVDDPAIFVGQRTAVRSAAGPSTEVATHGLEMRTLGGRWQKWVEWKDRQREQVVFPEPTAEGIYEMRAYAARPDESEVSYSNRALLTVAAIAPVITTQPVGIIANVGETVALTVGATGTEPAYQWRRNGAPVAGATRATLTFSPARVAQSGTYTVTASNSAGVATSRAVTVAIEPLNLPALTIDVSTFPAGGTRRSVALNAARVGDVVSIVSTSTLTAGSGWYHNVLIRRPAITSVTALVPEDGSGLSSAHEAWNKDGWGNPFVDGNTYDPRVTGGPAIDLGNREPFIHRMSADQRGSSRSVDLVLDAPGAWLVRAEIVDGAGQLIAQSSTTTIDVSSPALPTRVEEMSYPYGRSDRFVGVFWNAGQAHRLWSTWRAEFQVAYRPTWAVNWKFMWQPSPYFRAIDGGWLRPNPAAESPWQPFWSAHQVYALVPDGNGGSTLTHDLTSEPFAEKAALRLMDIGVDFVAVDYTNQFLEEREDVLPAVNNLAVAFQSVARQSQSGQRIRLSAVLPANVTSGDWYGSGGFVPLAIARFNAKLTTIYNRFARFESAWFYLEDDNGERKPLLMLWIGAGGEGEPDGTLAPDKLNQLRLTDGRPMTSVFTIRWVGAYLSSNPRFLTGDGYTVTGTEGAVSGRYANPKLWSYHEHFPSTATLAVGARGPGPAVEAVTVQPLAPGRDRFGRPWETNWPVSQGFHYETPATSEPVPLARYGRTWREALAAARALNPKFLLTTWAEFGSENDEPRPELSVTIMDNNKFGTHFGDALKQTVRLFKYREPTAWIDTMASNDATVTLADVAEAALPTLRLGQTARLQGWVAPNVGTTFPGGSVKVYVDDELHGAAIVGGAWNGATRWYFDLKGAVVGLGRHTVKVVAEDGVGGSALAGVQFRGERPRNTLPIVVTLP